MECRAQCGACCIAPSINQGFYGMPNGKPAGVACVHLDKTYACKIFNQAERPPVCSGFKAELDMCGDDRDQAIAIISELELITLTNK